MPGDVDLTIVIPCRDCAATIGEQLEAIASQEWDGSWEVVVADNGSSDQTRAVVEGFRDRITHLRVVGAAGVRGAAHARNIGVREARGDAVLYCDADDVVGEGWLAAMGDALRRHEFVSARLDPVRFNEEWVREGREWYPGTSGPGKTPHPPFLYNVPGGLMGVRRRLHDAIGGFDETLSYMQDSDYALRLQLQGAELVFVPEAIVHVRGRDTMRGIFRQALRWGQANALLQRKYDDGQRMIRNRLRWAVKGWKPVLLALPKTYRRGGRAWFLWTLGWQLGRLYGSARHRIYAI
jgi:glycosyltransferase involved in cell wall biosynthesis